MSLEELDERAALQRRVDQKYVLSRRNLDELLSGLRDDHQILEIDGRRAFTYESGYFDTPDLRCFQDHVRDRTPRFKARTRLYVDSDQCSFELKLKLDGDETRKEQIDLDPSDHGRMTPETQAFLAQVLGEIGDPPPGEEMQLALRTSFVRATLAAAGSPERMTCDHRLELRAADGRSVRLRDELVIVETKTEDGEGQADRLLRARGAAPVSFSKYRVGIGLLVERDPDPPLGERLAEAVQPL